MGKLKELTNQQTIALNAMLEFLKSKRRYFTLEGFPGSGKTELMKHLLAKIYTDKKYSGRIFISAPTNQALNVIRDKTKGFGAKYCTVQRGMGLKLDCDENGNQIWKFGEPAITNPKLWIIDEASMINCQLYAQIRNFARILYPSMKIIFVGDRNQLPPVNENLSKVFSEGFSDIVLTEVVRNDGEIVKICNFLRNCLEKQIFPSPERLCAELRNLAQNGNAFVISKREFQSLVTSYWGVGGDPKQHCLYLAFKNKQVNDINYEIRKRCFDSLEKLYNPFEKLIAKDYFKILNDDNDESSENSDTMFYTSDTFTIIDVEIVDIEFALTKKVHDTHLINCYKLTVVKNKSDDEISVLYKITKAGFQKFKKIETALNSEANKLSEIFRRRNTDKNSEKAIQAWKRLQHFRWKFDPPINYAYAVTTHKSQGMTLDVCFVDVCDILSTYCDYPTKFRSLHTAISRAQNRAYLIL